MRSPPWRACNEQHARPSPSHIDSIVASRHECRHARFAFFAMFFLFVIVRLLFFSTALTVPHSTLPLGPVAVRLRHYRLRALAVPVALPFALCPALHQLTSAPTHSARWRPVTNETSSSRKAPCTRMRLHPHLHGKEKCNGSTVKIAFNLLAAALRFRLGSEEFC